MSVHGHLELEVWSLRAKHFNSGLRPETLYFFWWNLTATFKDRMMKAKKLSLTELSNQYDEQQREFEEMRLAATQDMYLALAALAQHLGITLRQLFDRYVKPGDKPRPVFYLNPADISQQWRGRGAKPKWLRDWLAEGKSLDMVRF